MTTRRLTAAVGVVAAVLAGIAAAPPAFAARGVLKVNDETFTDPSGCYEVKSQPIKIENRTDQVAVVFSEPNCRGFRLARLGPGIWVTALGKSVQIP